MPPSPLLVGRGPAEAQPFAAPTTATLDPAVWAALTYGDAALGDTRRTQRVVATMAAIAAHPTASLPQQLRAPAALKATYRLLHEPDITAPSLLAPHLAATRGSAATHPVVLF